MGAMLGSMIPTAASTSCCYSPGPPNTPGYVPYSFFKAPSRAQALPVSLRVQAPKHQVYTPEPHHDSQCIKP